ncbi:MAG: prepilin-type cleavage/methylation domain-containing protein, partial [Gammaproteobacteria bacterium]|nr:prepilin-type cleavage/methylation domain-containing protein [Gammaproteobacteria bacterium]
MKQIQRLPIKLRGMSLVELLVASTIGLFLIGGAIAMYQSSQSTYLVNETYSRLQDNAR